MNDANPIAISALQRYAYCQRQCALIHVDRQRLMQGQDHPLYFGGTDLRVEAT